VTAGVVGDDAKALALKPARSLDDVAPGGREAVEEHHGVTGAGDLAGQGARAGNRDFEWVGSVVVRHVVARVARL
jgi:hypothetical protein